MNDTIRRLNPRLELNPATPGTKHLLDTLEKTTRTNSTNDGRGFQKEIERTCAAYQNRRTATLRKVDPPTRVIGRTPEERRVFFMANPFLDFVGVWTARHGRALFVEAKSTATHRLPFSRSGGITSEQVGSIKTWRLAGAAACVVWKFGGKVVLLTPEHLMEAERLELKSITFDRGLPVVPGEGFILWDFLPVLERALWP